MKHPEELAEFKMRDIKIVKIRDILSDLRDKRKLGYTAAGTDLLDLMLLYDIADKD